MNSKILRFIVILLQILIAAAELGICIYGIVLVEDINDSYPFITTVVRVAIILLLTIAYFKTSVSKINPGNLFVIMALFFLTLAELSILSYFTTISGWSFIPPRALVRTVLGAQLMAHFALIGYALQYQTNEHSSIVRLFVVGMTAVVFLVVLIPSSQEVSILWKMPAPLTLLIVLAAVAAISQLILAFTETTRAGSLRQIATLILIAGNFLTLVFNDLFVFQIIGTALFFIGGFVLMIITLRNSVIL